MHPLASPAAIEAQTPRRAVLFPEPGMEPGEDSAHVPVKQELDDEEMAMQAEMQETSSVPSKQHSSKFPVHPVAPNP